MYSSNVAAFSVFAEDTVTSLWNCEILQNDSDLCSIASVEYNGSIAPEVSVSIGYTTEGCSYKVKDVNITTQIADAGVEIERYYIK